MAPIKVLHLITELDTGGAQIALLRLLACLDRQRYAAAVACLYNGQASVARQIGALGIPVTDLGMPSRWRLDALLRLYRLLRRERPHLLHTWMFHANLPGRILGRLAGVPIVISSQRTMGMEGAFRRTLDRLTAPLADRVICVSQAVAEYAVAAIGLPPDQLAVIPNGVPLEDFEPLPPREQARAALDLPAAGPLIGTASRAHPVKGLDVLLEAFSSLSQDFPAARLAIAGDGPQLPALERRAARLGCERRVTFLGRRQDVPLFLAALDAFALPSFHEGLPNAALEAMAAGLPVVASRVGGMPEAVEDGVTGFLVPPGDPRALAGALGRLLADPALARRLGEAARQRVARLYPLSRTVQETERLYEALLAGRSSP